MTPELIIFIVLASIAAVSSVLMVLKLNAVISALFLVLNFFALGGIYLLLQAQFIAVVQVIVYAGAIMVLFIFVLMLLNAKEEESILKRAKYLKVFAIVTAFVVFAEIAYVILTANVSAQFAQMQPHVNNGTIQSIGHSLYTDYIIPFEAAGFLLLAATIGALLLAKKKFK